MPKDSLTDKTPAYTPEVLRAILYQSTQERWRPEEVAWLIFKLLPLSTPERERLAPLARRSCYAMRNSLTEVTALGNDFRKPVAPRPMAQTAALLFEVPPLSEDALREPERILDYVAELGQQIRRAVGDDFKERRLNREARRAAGLGDFPKRKYNRLFRLLVDLEEKVAVYRREWEKYRLMRLSKSGLTGNLDVQALHHDNTLAFVAYMVANQNRRSIFTVGSQVGAFDKISELLFKRCVKDAGSRWDQIALVYPAVAVLRHLDAEALGRLLGLWYAALGEAARFMEQVWAANEINFQTMVVKKGDDSGTWNLAAGAWNQSRKAWLNLVSVMNMMALFDDFLPGKAMRLIAGDVAAWHAHVGDDWVAADVKVWRELPLPWEVFFGRAVCNRPMIEAACRKYKVSPTLTGWIEPPPAGEVLPVQMTPELVHGVVVSSPELAERLRRLNFFSGKGAKGEPTPEERGAGWDALLEHRAGEEGKRE